MSANKYIRFDWAMKRLLRDKANFGVLEGLLTTLLGEPIKIKKLLESESNQNDEDDKQNRVLWFRRTGVLPKEVLQYRGGSTGSMY